MTLHKKILSITISVLVILDLIIGGFYYYNKIMPVDGPVVPINNQDPQNNNFINNNSDENLTDLRSIPIDNELGFSINPPKYWVKKVGDGTTADVLFVNPVADQNVGNIPTFGTSINIKNYGNAYKNDIDTAKNDITAWLSRNLSKFEYTSTDKIIMDKAHAYILLASYKNGAVDMVAKYMIVTSFDGRTFLTSSASTKETWDKRKDLINRAILSFRLK